MTTMDEVVERLSRALAIKEGGDWRQKTNAIRFVMSEIRAEDPLGNDLYAHRSFQPKLEELSRRIARQASIHPFQSEGWLKEIQDGIELAVLKGAQKARNKCANYLVKKVNESSLNAAVKQALMNIAADMRGFTVSTGSDAEDEV